MIRKGLNRLPDCRAFTAIRTEIIESLRNFLNSQSTMDDGIAKAFKTLKPDKLPSLSSEEIKVVQQKLLLDLT